MSLIATRLSLIHLASVERNANIGSNDGWGNPLPPDWEPSIDDLPCRAWTAGHQTVTDKGTIAVVIQVNMMVLLGTDVVENDRVAAVTHRGTVIFPGPLAVHAVLTRRDYLELILAKAS